MNEEQKSNSNKTKFVEQALYKMPGYGDTIYRFIKGKMYDLESGQGTNPEGLSPSSFRRIYD